MSAGVRRALQALAAIVLLLGVAAGFGAWRLQGLLDEAYPPGGRVPRLVEIAPGSPVSQIARQLAEAEVIRDARLLRLAVWLRDAERDLKAGEYLFDRALTPYEIVDKLRRGEVHLRTLTFREGLTLVEMAEVFEAGGFGSRDEFLAAARDPVPVRALDPDAPDLEGYLFPETYALPRSATAADLVSQMVRRFLATYDDELRARATARGLSTREVVTLASLVEKETGRGDERPLVAAVYTNRLRIGMPMQCDPTVIYALTLAGTYDGNLRRRDLEFDSPYNTYRYPGLPPGPIAAPGEASLRAAVSPADVDYLYFVSRNDGSHAFARTFSEHQRNVHEYQVLYFRRQRAAEREPPPRKPSPEPSPPAALPPGD